MRQGSTGCSVPTRTLPGAHHCRDRRRLHRRRGRHRRRLRYPHRRRPNARFGFPIARTLGNCLSMSNLARLSPPLTAGPRVIENDFHRAPVLPGRGSAVGRPGQPGAARPAGGAGAHEPTELAQTACRTCAADHARDERGVAAPARQPAAATPEDLIQPVRYESRDFREGMDAFLTKRTPNWKGK